MAAISPARATAFQILLQLERGHAHADDLLRSGKVSSLSVANRNLVTALVLGVLRWQILLDHRIQALLARPNAKLDPEARIALRLGAFQLLYMDRIPAHAAIDEAVELAKHAGHNFASRMVNAVLRKLASKFKPSLPEAAPEQLALASAHPAWLVERWIRFYGPDQTKAICAHHQEQPTVSIRINGPAVEEELAAAGVELVHGQLLTAARRVVAGDVTATAALREGRLRLQDEGSQLVAEIAGRGDAILDCCAAPGGKTLILAERNRNAHIVAFEASPHRLNELQARLCTIGTRIDCRLGDAATLLDDSAYDLVLADVPCSGTGTLGRNPEIRHRLRQEDLARQAGRQRAILRAAWRAVRPGGRVIYSTCSLEPEENEEVVAAVEADTGDIRVRSIWDRIEELLAEKILTTSGAERLRHCVSPEGYLRLLPGAVHTDGFFVAHLEKQVP